MLEKGKNSTMKQSYWKQYYVLETDADEIERHLQRTTFRSGGTQFELIYFEEGKNAPTILISQGLAVMRMSSPSM